jgi:hypothetical protein
MSRQLCLGRTMKGAVKVAKREESESELVQAMEELAQQKEPPTQEQLKHVLDLAGSPLSLEDLMEKFRTHEEQSK